MTSDRVKFTDIVLKIVCESGPRLIVTALPTLCYYEFNALDAVASNCRNFAKHNTSTQCLCR